MIVRVNDKDCNVEYITWKDHSSFSDQNWRDLEELDNLDSVLVFTTGIVVHEDDEKIKVIMSLTRNCQFSGIFCILKADIIERSVLVEGPNTEEPPQSLEKPVEKVDRRRKARIQQDV